MSTVVACDAGLRGFGLAIYVNGELSAAEYVENTEMTVRGPAAWRAMSEAVSAVVPLDIDVLVVEIMQKYRDQAFIDPNQLLQVNGAAGAVIGAVTAREYVGVLPRQWTANGAAGSKEERQVALRTELVEVGRGELERVLLPRLKGLAHNVWDAVGIGLWWVKRQGERVLTIAS